MPKLLDHQHISAHGRTGTMGAGSLPQRRDGARIAHPGTFSVRGSHGIVGHPEPKRSIGSLIASLHEAEIQDNRPEYIEPPVRRRPEPSKKPSWTPTTYHNAKLEAQSPPEPPPSPPVTSPQESRPTAADKPAFLRLHPPPPPAQDSRVKTSPSKKAAWGSPKWVDHSAYEADIAEGRSPTKSSPTKSSPTKSSPTKSALALSPASSQSSSRGSSPTKASPKGPTGKRVSRGMGNFSSVREMDDLINRLEVELSEHKAGIAEKLPKLTGLQNRFKRREEAKKVMEKQMDTCQKLVNSNSKLVFDLSTLTVYLPPDAEGAPDASLAQSPTLLEAEADAATAEADEDAEDEALAKALADAEAKAKVIAKKAANLKPGLLAAAAGKADELVAKAKADIQAEATAKADLISSPVNLNQPEYGESEEYQTELPDGFKDLKEEVEDAHEYCVEHPDGALQYGDVIVEDAILKDPTEWRLAGGDSGIRPFPVGTKIESSVDGGKTWDLEYTIKSFKLSDREKEAAAEKMRGRKARSPIHNFLKSASAS
jgi:hypothetical protein